MGRRRLRRSEACSRAGLSAMFCLVPGIFLFCHALHAQAAGPGAAGPQGSPALTITFDDALSRARANEPEFHAALAAYGVARENLVQSRSRMLPNVNFTSSFIFTQGDGAGFPRFIANNGVHEYLNLGNAHQELSWQMVAEYKGARAIEALARAQSEIAARGLSVAVTRAYYGMVVGQRKYAIAQRAAGEAQNFSDITEKLEKGGEVAHSDTIKAQLELSQQQRGLADARLEMERSRLELAVLIFPNFNENFSSVDDLDNLSALPSYQEVETLAGNRNPQLRAAIAGVEAANQQVAVAWASFLPKLSLDYFYGIDANQFAIHGVNETITPPHPVRNLGYSAVATLEIPVWNWGASRSKVRGAELERDQARTELSFAQRKLAAELRNFYNEAQTSRAQLESLRQSTELAAESLRLTTLRYQAGEATVLEVVDAQNTLTAAQNQLGDGQVRYRVALAELETLTGRF
ncbi:MAG: TolC family protein [Acidobacteria bacterium]|nr:TolC family protein [Acidobacteriota bacterium]